MIESSGAGGRLLQDDADSIRQMILEALARPERGLWRDAVGEALLFASKAGADPAKVRQALMGGFANSRILEVHGERMVKRTFNPGFRIALHQKDLNLALAGAKAMGVAATGGWEGMSPVCQKMCLLWRNLQPQTGRPCQLPVAQCRLTVQP